MAVTTQTLWKNLPQTANFCLVTNVGESRHLLKKLSNEPKQFYFHPNTLENLPILPA